MKYLNCGGNLLSELNVSRNTMLEELRCFSNQLTSLDLQKNTALSYLDCSNNQLTALDMSKNTALTTLVCALNQIKGEAMDALVESLPTAENGIMAVVYFENEQNVMTTDQVAVAKAKGWTPLGCTGVNDQGEYSWEEYAGSEEDPDGISLSEELRIKNEVSGNIYNLAGQRLGKMQTGSNIVGGKKIIVK